MGLTDCDAFSTVTVPATDTTPPDTYDGAYEGEYKTLIANPGSETYHIASGEDVYAVSSGIDSGGVKKVEMMPSESWTCCSTGGGEHVCSGSVADMAPVVATQSGSVGSSVSNGVYTFLLVEGPSDDQYCNAGYTLTSWDFSWQTEAWDFHNNHTTGALQHIHYP